MRKLSMIVALSCVPAVVVAQSRATASAQAETRGGAAAGSETWLSAQSQARLEATFAAARARSLPEETIRNRVAEGQAKGASEAQIVMAAQRMEGRLEATQDAMIRAGRSRPSDAEIEGGARAMERGATTVQIEALVRSSPSARSLVVAFDAFSRSAATGATVDLVGAGVATGGGAAQATAATGTAINIGGAGAGVIGSASGTLKVIKPPTP